MYEAARLKDFITKAGERGIVVEICFFNAQYSDTWPISPLYYENNVQGAGKCDYQDAQTLKHADLAQRESDYVAKITQEVNPYDNVILEMCDEEPDIGFPPTPLAEAGAWVHHLTDVVIHAERDLPKKHLIAAQVEGPVGGPLDLSGKPNVSVIVTQYVWQAGFQMGGMRALDLEHGHDKPIESNETDWYPVWYKGDAIADSRVDVGVHRRGRGKFQPLERPIHGGRSCRQYAGQRPGPGRAQKPEGVHVQLRLPQDEPGSRFRDRRDPIWRFLQGNQRDRKTVRSVSSP